MFFDSSYDFPEYISVSRGLPALIDILYDPRLSYTDYFLLRSQCAKSLNLADFTAIMFHIWEIGPRLLGVLGGPPKMAFVLGFFYQMFCICTASYDLWLAFLLVANFAGVTFNVSLRINWLLDHTLLASICLSFASNLVWVGNVCSLIRLFICMKWSSLYIEESRDRLQLLVPLTLKGFNFKAGRRKYSTEHRQIWNPSMYGQSQRVWLLSSYVFGTINIVILTVIDHYLDISSGLAMTRIFFNLIFGFRVFMRQVLFKVFAIQPDRWSVIMITGIMLSARKLVAWIVLVSPWDWSSQDDV